MRSHILFVLLSILLLGSNAFADDAADTAHAQAVKADADAQKAQYDAQTSKYQAQEERIKASQAGLPQSGLSNSASPGTGAGTAEASYLSAELVAKLAQQTADAVVPAEATTDAACAHDVHPTYVVFAGMAAPDLSDWAAFSQRTSHVRQDMETAYTDATRVGHAGGGGVRTMAALPVIALIPSLLSFLNSADAAQGITLSEDDSVLVTDTASALLKKNCKVLIASQITNASAGAQLSKLLGEMADDRAKLDKKIDELKNNTAAKTIVDNMKVAAAEYDKLLADLYGSTSTDGKTTAPSLSLSTIVKEFNLAQALTSGRGVFVKIQAVSGGLFTRKNIATYFTANPFSVSASAIVSYSVIDGKDDSVKASGTVQAIAPYQAITEVK